MSISQNPLIAVPADTCFFDGYLWHGAPQQYLLAACEVAKLTPVIIPSLPDFINLDLLSETVDGVLITGAKSNVQPKLYGEAMDPARGPFDPLRDASSLPLIRFAIKREIPILAICRGIQELNVVLGGTLAHDIQDLPDRDDHRAPENTDPDEKFAIRQPVLIKEQSRLGAIVNQTEIVVNSVHQQAIEKLSDKLQIEATAKDGTIEAVSVKGSKTFAIGVQWHPEYWAKSDQPSKKIFEAFGEAVRAHYQQRTTV